MDYWKPPTIQVKTEVGERSRTKQASKDACDINAIMRRYHRTGMVDHLSGRTPIYGDFSEVGDYLDSMERVRAAQDAFDALPSAIRDACGNDPAELLDMATNPARAEEFEALGLEAGLVIREPEAGPKPEPEVPPSEAETPPGEEPTPG